jgi:hypothetical protein
VTRRRFVLRWYRCKCKRARVGVAHTEIVSRIRCVGSLAWMAVRS